MLKFISGLIRSCTEKYDLEATVFFLNNTVVAHADIAKILHMKVEHAGFCNITNTGFLDFYGKSISLQKGVDGMDRSLLNETIKEGIFYKEAEVFYQKYHSYFITIPKGYHIDFKLGLMLDKKFNFNEFVKKANEEYLEHIAR